jgi:hypothetical protein
MLDEARVTFEEDEFYRKGLYNGLEVWFRKEDGYVNATYNRPIGETIFWRDIMACNCGLLAEK